MRILLLCLALVQLVKISPSESAVADAAVGGAVLAMEGSVERIEADQLTLNQLRWSAVHERGRGWFVDISANQLRVAEQVFKLPAMQCRARELMRSALSCEHATLSLTHPSFDFPLRAQLSGFEADLRSGGLSLNGQLFIADLTVDIDASLANGALSWSAAVDRLPLSELAALKSPRQAVGLVLGSGLLSATINGRLQAGQPVEIQGRYELEQVAFDSADGQLAAIELAASGDLGIVVNEGSIELHSKQSVLSNGEALLGPVYLALTEAPVTLSLSANWTDRQLRVERFSVEDPGVLNVVGSAQLDWAQSRLLQHLHLDRFALSFPQANQRYLAEALDSLGWGRLQWQGSLEGTLMLSAGEVESLLLQPVALSINAQKQQVSLTDINGQLDYQRDRSGRPSQLSWQRISYFDLAFGPNQANFEASDGGIELSEPISLSLFDGAVNLQELLLRRLGSPSAELTLRGSIDPVSLRPITEALAWPVFGGTISGDIPRVTLRDEVVALDGAIVLDIFDGTVTFNQLSLERIFGVLPTLAADLQIDNIDLEKLTGAFSFGKIEGRLAGRVDGLRLLNWRPVAFDLDLHTPPDAGGRRRLSQRAVDNLSSIGGGSAASLQSGLLRLFEEFSYRDIGLKCRLRNHVCQMGGVAPGPRGGYYIVRGRGLPQINIVGFSNVVDWPLLVARLREAITNPGSLRVGDQ